MKNSPPVFKKLLLNALNHLKDYLSYEGYNDLDDNSPLLKDISKEEKLELEKLFVELCPKQVKEYNSKKILFNFQLIAILKNLVENDV